MSSLWHQEHSQLTSQSYLQSWQRDSEPEFVVKGPGMLAMAMVMA
jgi:hypothetical protein